MAEYHVGCGAFGIYAGTLNSNKTLWRNRSDVTDEAVSAVAKYMLQENKDVLFTYEGKRYRMCIVEEEKIEDAAEA